MKPATKMRDDVYGTRDREGRMLDRVDASRKRVRGSCEDCGNPSQGERLCAKCQRIQDAACRCGKAAIAGDSVGGVVSCKRCNRPIEGARGRVVRAQGGKK